MLSMMSSSSISSLTASSLSEILPTLPISLRGAFESKKREISSTFEYVRAATKTYGDSMYKAFGVDGTHASAYYENKRYWITNVLNDVWKDVQKCVFIGNHVEYGNTGPIVRHTQEEERQRSIDEEDPQPNPQPIPASKEPETYGFRDLAHKVSDDAGQERLEAHPATVDDIFEDIRDLVHKVPDDAGRERLSALVEGKRGEFYREYDDCRHRDP